jgi:hypothetical protein
MTVGIVAVIDADPFESAVASLNTCGSERITNRTKEFGVNPSAWI